MTLRRRGYLSEVKEVHLSFADTVDQNVKHKSGSGIEITPALYDWFVKKFGKGQSVSITKKSRALSSQEIRISKAKGRMGSVQIVAKPFGGYLRVYSDEGGAGRGKTRYFKENVLFGESASGIDGKTKAMAIRHVYKLVGRSLDGFFRDEYWTPVNKFWQTLNKNNISFAIQSSAYRKNRKGVSDGKVWKFTITFQDKKGLRRILYGTVTAAGAGSVKDPLDTYDVTMVLG